MSETTRAATGLENLRAEFKTLIEQQAAINGDFTEKLNAMSESTEMLTILLLNLLT